MAEQQIQVSLRAVAAVATECWRLERSIAAVEPALPSNMLAAFRHSNRRLRQILQELHIDVHDLSGQPYDAGLAVEVLGADDGEPPAGGRFVIREMVSPIVLREGIVVARGQVIIGYSAAQER